MTFEFWVLVCAQLVARADSLDAIVHAFTIYAENLFSGRSGYWTFLKPLLSEKFHFRTTARERTSEAYLPGLQWSGGLRGRGDVFSPSVYI